jgi:hypothetical protein
MKKLLLAASAVGLLVLSPAYAESQIDIFDSLVLHPPKEADTTTIEGNNPLIVHKGWDDPAHTHAETAVVPQPPGHTFHEGDIRRIVQTSESN